MKMRKTRGVGQKKSFSILALLLLTISLVTGELAQEGIVLGAEETEENQVIAVNPTGEGEGYSAVLYDNTNGLPTSEANAIAQTEEGFLWIGGYSGLLRYDGNTFERISSTTGISSVVSLFVDSQNRLWVGTNDGGLALMRGDEFTLYNKASGLASQSIQDIEEGEDQKIYVATTQGMVVIDKNLQIQKIDEPQINNEYISKLGVTEDKEIYGITKEGSLFLMKEGKLTKFISSDKLGVSNVHAIFMDPENPGYYYLATTENTIVYGKIDGLKKSRWKIIDISPLAYTNEMRYIGGKLWICTDNGVGYIENGRFTYLDNLPMTSSVGDVKVDYLGNLWFVSSQQGIMKIVPNQFTDLFEKYEMDAEVVNTTCLYDNRLFIGTNNNGLKVVEDGKLIKKMPVKEVKGHAEGFKDEDFLRLMSGSRIRSIHKDSKNRLWFCNFGSNCLVRYDKGVVTKFTTKDGFPSERVRAIYERKDGSFMVCCTGGLAILKDDKVVDVYNDKDGISNTEILTAIERDNGDMVVGTDGGGIYVINDDGVKHIGVEEGMSSDVVMRVKQDKERKITWCVTSNSISYLTDNYEVEVIKNFPYSNNFDLYANDKNQMWVLSSNGLYVVDTDQMVRNQEITPIHYGIDNGLQYIPTANSYSELSPEGDLYIAGTAGVSKVNIQQSSEDVTNFNMCVPYIEVDGQKLFVDKSGQVVIPSKAGKVTIYGFVYNYTLMNPEVSYRLDDLEDHFTTVKRSDLGPVTYTNLRGGDYNFIMQIKDPRGDKTKEMNLKIVKEKTFLEHLWIRIVIYILVVILILLAVWTYIKIRTKRFIRKENEQKQLIREIVEAFAKVIDMKDKYTNGHSTRVAQYTAMLTRELGYDEDTVDRYYNIALLHDIGKVGVPAHILNKAGKLTDQEFKIIKSHSAQGYNALKDISIMPELAIGAGAHHERPDGKGYPKGLKGDEIPRVAQIISVADTFDAMYSNRPYRNRMKFSKVVSIIKEVSGTQLAEDVVEAFLRLVDKGEFIAPDDDGTGTTEDIDNLRKNFEKEEK